MPIRTQLMTVMDGSRINVENVASITVNWRSWAVVKVYGCVNATPDTLVLLGEIGAMTGNNSTFNVAAYDEVLFRGPLPTPVEVTFDNWDAQTGASVYATVASLPAASTDLRGRIAFATNGRKAGEGPGSGTGVLVFCDGSAWIAVDTGTAVAA